MCDNWGIILLDSLYYYLIYYDLCDVLVEFLDAYQSRIVHKILSPLNDGIHCLLHLYNLDYLFQI